MNEKYLKEISNPNDIKNLNIDEINELSKEIREFLVQSISKTGGHLASNLGIVELTMALCNVFNFNKDKIVWDVGHQSYVYKLLTNRKSRFDTLRQFEGMSGFPKTSESQFDFFNTGHSSTSISAAVGMARARDLKKQKHQVIAVIGDGAMSGGMALEAMNDVGHRKTNVIFVLNDNEMSIDGNVGGLSKYISVIRNEPWYIRASEKTIRALKKIPLVGTPLKNIISSFKTFLKLTFLPGKFFNLLGVKYIGPVNGHDFREICKALEKAKKTQGPVLVHVNTVKGKGYKFAEEKPEKYHGVSPFNVEDGMPLAKSTNSFSSVFGESMVSQGHINKNVVSIVAAMKSGCGLDDFANSFPDRFFDVAIAEQHAVTLAAGLASQGMIPVVAIYSTFLQRAYDQILHDICLQNLHVVFGIDRAGVVGDDGETHQGIYDIAFLSKMPNMTILAPCDYSELRYMLDYAINKHNGPIAIRYPRGKGEEIAYEHHAFQLGSPEIIQKGTDIAIITVGNTLKKAIEVKEKLKKISFEIINPRTVLPFDFGSIAQTLKSCKRAVVLEDGVADGGFGEMLCSYLSDNSIKDVEVLRFAYPRVGVTHGKVNLIEKKYAIDAESIVDKISEKWSSLNGKG